jgi:hypothetical protein
MTKVDGYLIHSRLRGAQRYGLEIDQNEYESLSVKIGFHEQTQSQECVLLSKVSAGREKWAIWYKGEWIPLIFDPVQARIVTLLPRHDLRPFKQLLPW